MNCKAVVVVLLCCVFATFFAEPIPIQDCVTGSKLADITRIDVSPCPHVPCKFIPDSNVTVAVTFTSRVTVSTATVEAYGELSGFTLGKYPLKDTNACNGMKCPFTVGDVVTYTNSFSISKRTPQITLDVKLQIHFGSHLGICFIVPVTIIRG